MCICMNRRNRKTNEKHHDSSVRHPVLHVFRYFPILTSHSSESHPFDICLNQGRLVGWIRAAGGCVRVGETD